VSHLHFSRLPAGPSFDFRIDQFSLMSDLRKLIGSSAAVSRDDGQFPPVAILNGFKSADSEFAALLGEALKGLIPAIDISKINVRTCRRVVLFEYKSETNSLSIRHYRVNVKKRTVAMLPESSATSCSVILNSRKTSKIPNMGNLVSLSDLIAPPAITDDDSSQVKDGSASLFLTEIGPRIECTLSRVLSGVEEGTVMFSNFAPHETGQSVLRKKPKRKFVEKEKRATKRARSDYNQEEDFAPGEFSE
jgi:ribosome biogenesis protein SSF1/2